MISLCHFQTLYIPTTYVFFFILFLMTGMFSNFGIRDGFGTYTYPRSGRYYFGPFSGGKFDTSGKYYSFL